MAWVLDHIQILIAIAGAVAYWLNSRRKALEDTRPGDDGDTVSPMAEQADADERTRRIQEEIRRKIAERTGGTVPQPPVAIPSYRTPSAAPPPPLPARRMEELAPYARRERDEEEQAEIKRTLERQRGLAEQMAALEARRALASREAKAVWSQVGEPSVVRTASVSADVTLLQDLRNTRNLRRAIILREVLGTPAGLR